MTVRWHVLHSKPNREEVLWKHAVAEGHQAYYPCLHVQPVNPRSRSIRPYFPGYLFVRTDLSQVGLSTFRWMAHANGLVASRQ